jgi:hypothetical protein
MKWTKRELARLQNARMAADLPKGGQLQGRFRTAEEIAALEAERTARMNRIPARLGGRQAADVTTSKYGAGKNMQSFRVIDGRTPGTDDIVLAYDGLFQVVSVEAASQNVMLRVKHIRSGREGTFFIDEVEVVEFDEPAE